MGSKPGPIPAASFTGEVNAQGGAGESQLTAPERLIGQRLRELRIAHGFTQDRLAADTGFTKGYLSKIENSKVIPPIGTLVKIAHILGAELTELFGQSPVSDLDQRMCIDRARDRQDVIRSGTSFGYDYKALADKRYHKYMEPFIMIFLPEVGKDVSFDHEGEEFMFILSGKVELTVEIDGQRRVLILAPGDSAYFDSSIPHRGRSLSGESRALVMIYRQKTAPAF